MTFRCSCRAEAAAATRDPCPQMNGLVQHERLGCLDTCAALHNTIDVTICAVQHEKMVCHVVPVPDDKALNCTSFVQRIRGQNDSVKI